MFKAKLYAIGAGLLAFIAMFLRLQVVQNQRDRAKQQAETLKSRAKQAANQKKIKRKEEARLLQEKKEILEEISKPEEEFEGLDNLTDSNDF